jgi:hypothetical protein
MDINKLMQILPPPIPPVEISAGMWGAIEDQLGIGLPNDYKAFIDNYGSGTIRRFATVFNPFSQNKHINLAAQLPIRLNVLAGLRRFTDKHPEWLPYNLFPEPCGLFPFAGTNNGDSVYWVTDGPPDAWWVVVGGGRSPRYQEFKCNSTTFFYQILTRPGICDMFPVGFLGLEPPFRSINPS